MVHQSTSMYVKFDIVACPKIQGCVFLRTKKPCGRHIDHGVVGGTPKKTNKQQTPQDTCSKIPGAYVFQKKKPLREAHRPRGGGRSP